MTAALTATSIVWRDLTMAAATAGADYCLRDLKGWDELPPYTSEDVPVSGRHGGLLTPIRFATRSVTVTGWSAKASTRDALVAALRRATAPGRDTMVTEPLAITHAGQVLTADAQVVAAAALPEIGWALGRFGWVVQWLCRDPFRYGPFQSVTSPLALPVTGLALPASLPNAFPAKPTGGAFTVNNTGTAPASAIYTLQGGITLPGVVVNGGTSNQRIVSYSFDLGSSDLLAIDTARGAAFLNGAYRAPVAGSALTKELELLPGINSIAAVGAPGAGSPTVSVTFRPAYW